jgi:hypothetical protein
MLVSLKWKRRIVILINRDTAFIYCNSMKAIIDRLKCMVKGLLESCAENIAQAIEANTPQHQSAAKEVRSIGENTLPDNDVSLMYLFDRVRRLDSPNKQKMKFKYVV